MTKVRTRFAPSPTGYMHIGNLRTALYEYLVAKKDGGDFILRIEDTDQNRQVEGSVDIIYSTLLGVGLNYDEGPDKPGQFGPYIQSERLPMYKQYALELIDKGGAHICFCNEDIISAQRQAAEVTGTPYKFNDPCHNLDAAVIKARMETEPYVIRQTISAGAPTVFHDEVYGDIEVERDILDEQVLLKSDGFPTYNFANVVDDHTMEITHVVRGNEYLSSTPKYNLIYDSFGWPKPVYIHLPPVMKDEQHKLSKRNGDASFQDLVSQGYLPQAILNYIALLGWAPETTQEIFTLAELVLAFSVERISKSPAIFDIEKLKWMNGMYLRALSLEDFHALCIPFYQDHLTIKTDFLEISKMLQPRLVILSDIPEMIDFLNALPDYDVQMYFHPKMKTDKAICITALEASIELFAHFKAWDDVLAFQTALSALPIKLSLKNGQVYWPIRTAVTGKQFTPGGAMEIPYILGQAETIFRCQVGLAKLKALTD